MSSLATEVDETPLRELLASDAWVHAVRLQSDGPHAAYRWRHPLEDHFIEASQLEAFLKDPDEVVRTNSAIALARQNNGTGEEVLAAGVARWRAPNHFPEAMTCAAAEAWGAISLKQPEQVVTELEQAGLVVRNAEGHWQRTARYWPRLHAELIRTACRHVHPIQDRRLAQLLHIETQEEPDAQHTAASSQEKVVQLALVESFARRELALPSAVRERCHRSPHADVRIAVIRAAAQRVDDKSALAAGELRKLLDKMLNDADAHVQLAAIEAVMPLKNHAEHVRWAESQLRSALRTDGPLVRAAVVKSLAALKLFEPLAEHADDQSWRVREAVAGSLRGFSNPQAVDLATELADDSSTSVREALVEAIAADWPLPQTATVLLKVAKHSGPKLRRQAVVALTKRWPPAGNMDFEADEDAQLKQLASLGEQLKTGTGRTPEADESGSQLRLTLVSSSSKSTEQLSQFRSLLKALSQDDLKDLRRQEILRELGTLSPKIPALLDALSETGYQVNPQIRAEVLPQVCEVFAVMDRLRAEDPVERRRAAAQLVEQAQLGHISLGCWEELESAIVREQDPLVWRSLLLALNERSIVGPDNAATRLVYAAVSHPVAEVRRRACACLGEHPQSAHAGVMKPALSDTDPSVLRAAVQAIGKCGPMADVAPLERLLAHSDHQLRLMVAVSLTELGSPSGTAALERLSYDPDTQIRAAAAREMGRLQDPSFLPSLMRLLDDQLAVQRAALNALPQVAGTDATTSGNRGQNRETGALSSLARITLWREWYARRVAEPAKTTRQ